MSPAPSQSLISRQTMLYSSLHIHTITRKPFTRVSAPVEPLPNYCLHIYRLLVLLQSCLIVASKFISKLARSQHRTVSLNLHDYGLQTHFQTHSITVSNLARTRHPSLSATSPCYNLRVHLKTRSVTVSKLARLSPHSLHHHSLQVHLQPRSVTEFKCTFKLERLWPRRTSLCSLDQGVVEWWSTMPDSLSSTPCCTSRGILLGVLS